MTDLMTKENVCRRLVLVEANNLDTSQKKEAIKFIVENRLDVETLPDSEGLSREVLFEILRFALGC
jgi:hypothetical protein